MDAPCKIHSLLKFLEPKYCTSKEQFNLRVNEKKLFKETTVLLNVVSTLVKSSSIAPGTSTSLILSVTFTAIQL